LSKGRRTIRADYVGLLAPHLRGTAAADGGAAAARRSSARSADSALLSSDDLLPAMSFACVGSAGSADSCHARLIVSWNKCFLFKCDHIRECVPDR
jgi:hypothetical protein